MIHKKHFWRSEQERTKWPGVLSKNPKIEETVLILRLKVQRNKGPEANGIRANKDIFEIEMEKRDQEPNGHYKQAKRSVYHSKTCKWFAVRGIECMKPEWMTFVTPSLVSESSATAAFIIPVISGRWIFFQ